MNIWQQRSAFAAALGIKAVDTDEQKTQLTQPTKAALLKGGWHAPERGVQSVQGRIRHKRYPSRRRRAPVHLLRSSLEPIAPRAPEGN